LLRLATRFQATLELFDKWGRRYEGSAPGTGAAKIAATWRELMKDGNGVEVVHLGGSYFHQLMVVSP